MYPFDLEFTPPPPLQPQSSLVDEWLDAKGEGIWCGECKYAVRSDECIHRKPLRPSVISAIESPRRRRYLSEGLYAAERMTPPSAHIDPIATLWSPPDQPAVQKQQGYETVDTTISRMATPYLEGPPCTPPRRNRNLDAIHEELDFEVFDGNKVVLREAGKPVMESTPTKKGPSLPTSPETPRRSKRLQASKDSKGSPRTPSHGGLVHVDQNMASPISPKKRGPRTPAKENGKVRSSSSSPRKRRPFGKATRMEE